MNSRNLFPLRRREFRVRDPFIVADADAGLYRLYVQRGNRSRGSARGVSVYSSPDLVRWSRPRPVLVLPPALGVQAVWAPEVHRWRDKWYLLATLTFPAKLKDAPPVASPDWPALVRRGTHVFRADSPLGPFRPLRRTSLTPREWMSLDGTLYAEDGVPWLVFCHEWVQVRDGRMMAVRLKPDLGGTIGKPRELFRASAAPGCGAVYGRGLVTDGPFLHRTANGALLMLWSTFIPGQGYSLLAARSAGDGIAGPWKEQRLVAGNDGGHGMLFRTFRGKLCLALHRPNSGGRERLRVFPVRERGARFSLK